MPIYIATSRWFVLIASVFYGSTALALLLVDWPYWVVASIFIVLIYDYRQVIRSHGLRKHKNSVIVIKQDCNKWQYQLFSGAQYRGKLIRQRSYSSSLVIILYLQNMTGARYVVVPRDSLSQHNYRFLAMQING
jgi:hypothetical protein